VWLFLGNEGGRLLDEGTHQALALSGFADVYSTWASEYLAREAYCGCLPRRLL
jgi:hypothetical protein